MKKVIDWKLCEKSFIRRVEIDLERIESLEKVVLIRLDRARKTRVTSENVSLVVEDYYEVIKELLVAYLLKNGIRSQNHQCLISYFAKENPKLEAETILISQMSFFTNFSKN